MARASGPFDVKLTPQVPDGVYENAQLGRLTLDKAFHGDLDATSRGQMLTGGTHVNELTGLSGKMAIIIEGKAPSYDFEYGIMS